jgi:hypothetical protein
VDDLLSSLFGFAGEIAHLLFGEASQLRITPGGGKTREKTKGEQRKGVRRKNIEE